MARSTTPSTASGTSIKRMPASGHSRLSGPGTCSRTSRRTHAWPAGKLTPWCWSSTTSATSRSTSAGPWRAGTGEHPRGDREVRGCLRELPPASHGAPPGLSALRADVEVTHRSAKRATGIEPAPEPWKGSVQPKHFARAAPRLDARRHRRRRRTRVGPRAARLPSLTRRSARRRRGRYASSASSAREPIQPGTSAVALGAGGASKRRVHACAFAPDDHLSRRWSSRVSGAARSRGAAARAPRITPARARTPPGSGRRRGRSGRR